MRPDFKRMMREMRARGWSPEETQKAVVLLAAEDWREETAASKARADAALAKAMAKVRENSARSSNQDKDSEIDKVWLIIGATCVPTLLVALRLLRVL